MPTNNKQIHYLIIQHGESRKAVQDPRLKEVREDPNHGHLGSAALCRTRVTMALCLFRHLSLLRAN